MPVYNSTANINGFYGYDKNENELLKFILSSLNERNLGRRLLLRICNEYGYNTTEHRIRKMLKYLGDSGYIEYGIDYQSGAIITEKGRKWVEIKKYE